MCLHSRLVEIARYCTGVVGLVHQIVDFHQVLPVIFFFSFVVSILYYYGAMQWTIRQLGSIFQAAMGTSICEGVIVAGNIFLGQTESPLLIKPYIKVCFYSFLFEIFWMISTSNHLGLILHL